MRDEVDCRVMEANIVSRATVLCDDARRLATRDAGSCERRSQSSTLQLHTMLRQELSYSMNDPRKRRFWLLNTPGQMHMHHHVGYSMQQSMELETADLRINGLSQCSESTMSSWSLTLVQSFASHGNAVNKKHDDKPYNGPEQLQSFKKSSARYSSNNIPSHLEQNRNTVWYNPFRSQLVFYGHGIIPRCPTSDFLLSPRPPRPPTPSRPPAFQPPRQLLLKNPPTHLPTRHCQPSGPKVIAMLCILNHIPSGAGQATPRIELSIRPVGI